MNVPSLAPIFASLRLALNLLIVLLVGFIIIREGIEADASAMVAIALAVIFLATYAAGGAWLRPRFRSGSELVFGWLALLTVEALALVWISPNASYLVFPLFFLYLYLVPQWWDVVAVVTCTLLTILVFAIEGRLTAAGVIGPSVAASVAIAIGIGYRALYWENQERQRLIEQLLATREELFEKEREAGTLAERARLAREIHDTLAQGLSSIQMLLHAAERADAQRPGVEHIRLARQTAATNLEEARRFIRELTPAALDQQSLVGALERLAESTRHAGTDGLGGRASLDVDFRTEGVATTLPMNLETALLRLAQGALANVVQHANATRAIVTLTYMEDSVSLDIVDNGVGFDPMAQTTSVRDRGSQSFGLVAMRDRVAQLGGGITIESSPGAGTAVAITFGLDQ